MVLILGRYLAQLLTESDRTNSVSPVDVFLRFEQLCAYIRHISHGVGGDIRGIDTVRKRSRTQSKIPIQTGQEGKILTDQKLYGLWGLFSVPARTSQLIEDDLTGVTEPTATFIEDNYMPSLRRVMKPLTDLLLNGGRLNAKQPNQTYEALSGILSEKFTQQERSFYDEYLCNATNARPNPVSHQGVLKKLLLDEVHRASPIGRDTFESLKVKATALNTALADRLDQILRLEAVFSTSMEVFNFLLTRDRESAKAISQHLLEKWGKSVPNIDPKRNDDLFDEIDRVYPDTGDFRTCFDRCQRALFEGSYEELIAVVIQWNKAIMDQRGGSPWLALGSDGCLEVRYFGRELGLAQGDDLSSLWHNGYFVTSLHSIVHQLARQAN